MKQRHTPRHLFWRGVIAGVSDVAMVTGVYPVLPHVGMTISRWRRDRPSVRALARTVCREWAVAVVMSAARPAGFLGLPGRRRRGPRPIILIHGYAMNRANFLPLSVRLARAGLGPIAGFEYWSLGKTASAARRLAAYVDQVRAATGAAEVDLVGHSMGGVVGRYYVSLGGGDGVVRNLITIGSPLRGTEVAPVGLGRPAKELAGGSSLMQRLAAAPAPSWTRVTAIWSRADAMVPGAWETRIDGIDRIVHDGLGHLSMLASRDVADEVIERLRA
jgi:pimeloyl-ACP methyl ester carboxylesterase